MKHMVWYRCYGISEKGEISGHTSSFQGLYYYNTDCQLSNFNDGSYIQDVKTIILTPNEY